MSQYQQTTLSPALLTKALLRAVEQLGLADPLPSMLGAGPEEVAQLQSGTRELDPQRREWQAALEVVGLFRTSIEVLGSVERAKQWLGTANDVLGGRPIDLLKSAEAERVHRYLKSVRKHELRMPPPSRREH
ncbi:DUF2384 domain-containing protein [Steroidobacter sp. S1-65]|uniref:DUF2384 domain-containing protein n=1 Tax=Steroidobacter gossypii TaxID=2805490 RepID=A0ABS1WUK0_9GAMM|nr:MbcA/ParS/Xre antitoxin family protein [Steroidobacter gossypii]MBM0104646.1 DUF2384 domain-containing protein [Steroidobacter gossypii]